MAFNEDRFVIIDGVQTSKARAQREGLVDAKGKPITQPSTTAASDGSGPSSTRARTADSTRRKSGKAEATEAPADAEGDADADPDAAE